jgi:hypothetical protein
MPGGSKKARRSKGPPSLPAGGYDGQGEIAQMVRAHDS